MPCKKKQKKLLERGSFFTVNQYIELNNFNYK